MCKLAAALALLLLLAFEAGCTAVPAERPDVDLALMRYREAFAGMRSRAVPPSRLDPNQRLFTAVLHLVLTSYARPVDPERLIDTAIQGLKTRDRDDPGASDRALTVSAIETMLASLDRHSTFLDAEHVRDVREQMNGEFTGLGIEVVTDRETGLLRVVASDAGAPAAHAGVHPGDLISMVNEREIKGLRLPDAVANMRGPAGNAVSLQLLRPDSDVPLRVSVTHVVIRLKPVVSWLDGGIAYIRLIYFNEQSSHHLRDALEDLRRQNGGKLAGIVLDLRDNPGGLFEQGIKVAESFVGPMEIVSTQSRNLGVWRYYGSPGDSIPPDLPMVALIDRGSSSSAEIVAGALQDHHRAQLFGRRSYGKGSVQTIFLLPDGEGLRLTTAHYFRPSGAAVECFGITPDVEIPGRGAGERGIHRDSATCASGDHVPPPPQTRRMTELCPEVVRALPKPGTDGPLECAFAAIRAGRISVRIGGP
ncbi:S41 family peptidase [Azospirillum doebereinerae]